MSNKKRLSPDSKAPSPSVLRSYFSQIGKKGGSKSRRVLDSKTARLMALKSALSRKRAALRRNKTRRQAKD